MSKKPADKSFGKRLGQLRKQRGFTLRELAKKVGTSTRSIFSYEKQSRYPPSYLIPKMSEALSVSVEELLGMKPTKTRATLDPKDAVLWRTFQRAKALPKKDQQAIVQYTNVLLVKYRNK